MQNPLVFRSRRSPVYARGGMAAASQPLAVAAGVEMLSRGGSAADAAVAVAAALSVTEPGSTGLGGDAFVLYYAAKERKVYALNGSGRAPAALSLERVQREGLGAGLPADHAYTVTVPGACAAWCDLSARFGRLGLGAALAPAVRLAEEGFPVGPLTARLWESGVGKLLRRSPNGLELTVEGRAPRPGEIFRNPGMARALRAAAEGGAAAFYQGAAGEAICAAVRQAGGCLSMEDLAAHTSTWEEPIHTDYRGVRVWECGPNGQGLTALLALNLLRGYDVGRLPALGAQRLHLTAEALRLAFADARHFIADPAFAPIPLEALLSEDYAAQRRRLMDPQRANPQMHHGQPMPGGRDTVYFCTADAEGNACSMVNSIYWNFGSGIVPQGWGFCLQNRGHNFSLEAGHANVLAPGKRPYHTIIAAMLTAPESGQLVGAMGVMGGFMQPQGHVQVLSALLDDGLDPQSALDRLRFCLEWSGGEEWLTLEEGIPAGTVRALAARGHAVRTARGDERTLFGRGQIILRDEQGVLWGGSEPRSDGGAAGLI